MGPVEAKGNLAKHGRPLRTHVAVFGDPLQRMRPDPQHPDRWITLGAAKKRLLVVVHTDAETAINDEGQEHTTIRTSPRAVRLHASDEPIVMSAEDAFARANATDWPATLPTDDAAIDLSDIPEQDWSGPEVVRGRYREVALAAGGFVVLDPDVRAAFPDTAAVNQALRGLMDERSKA